MLIQAARWLSVVWGGSLFASVASATIYELSDGSVASGLRLGATSLAHASLIAPDAPHAATHKDYRLPTRISLSALMHGISQPGYSLLSTVDYAEALDFRPMQTHSYSIGYLDNLRPYGLSNAEAGDSEVAAAPASGSGMWAMLLFGAGLVGYQLRRKSKMRGVRIASSRA